MKTLFSAAVLVMASAAHADTSFQDRYPGPWKEDFNAPISKALAQNSARGCGEFKYRQSSKDKGEYLVYCTRDGRNWSAYFVWPSIKKITGPHQVSAAIPP